MEMNSQRAVEIKKKDKKRKSMGRMAVMMGKRENFKRRFLS